MKKELIAKLNKLNTDFYESIASEFSDSRTYNWTGWDRLVLELKNQGLKLETVLDLGCGNGRFGNFINKEYGCDNYLGVDNSRELLKQAINNAYYPNMRFEYVNFLENYPKGKYDLIAAFGVMHHVPSFHLRKKLVENIVSSLTEKGLAVITLWQFLDKSRLAKKIIDWSVIDVLKSELEPNDYLLDWRRGKLAYRYCHYVDENEQRKLLKGSGANLLQEYLEDGKDKLTNKYLILSKN